MDTVVCLTLVKWETVSGPYPEPHWSVDCSSFSAVA